MQTPDITQAQIVAALGWVAAQAVAWGWLTNAREQTIVSIGATVVAAAWKLADAIIRYGRATGGTNPEKNITGGIAELFAKQAPPPAS